MTVRNLFTGQFQYQTIQEALGAGQWMDTWWSIHYSQIRPAGSAYSVSALIPPVVMEGDPGPANGQVSFTLHVETDTQQEASDMTIAVSTALGDGGVYQSIGESSTSFTPE